jgi:tetratricopeptide (TPR) repeat protein
MRRRFSAVAFLVGLALAATALTQTCVGAPLPAQGGSQDSLVAKAQAALDAKQWPEAEAALKQLVASAPRWEYSQALGTAQINQGHYADSLASYQHAIELAPNHASPAAMAQIYVMIGNANLKLKQTDAAITAYNRAAELGPNPAIAYFNLCATLYNTGQPAAKTAAACDKAIAADPKKADAYFVKGSSLFGDGTVDKNKKFVVPPGAVEALKQYLVLAPDGPHVQDVKSMLDALK